MQQIFPERAVFYGDTLFETIRVSNGTARLLDWHIERLLAGLRLLGMQPSEHWSTDFFRQEIAAKTSGNARVRLTVWREAGGLYLPESTSSAFSLHVYPLSGAAFSWPERPLSCSVYGK